MPVYRTESSGEVRFHRRAGPVDVRPAANSLAGASGQLRHRRAGGAHDLEVDDERSLTATEHVHRASRGLDAHDCLTGVCQDARVGCRDSLRQHFRLPDARVRLRLDAAVASGVGCVVRNQQVVDIVARWGDKVAWPTHQIHETEHPRSSPSDHAERPEIHDARTESSVDAAGRVWVRRSPPGCSVRLETVELPEPRERLQATVVRAVDPHQLSSVLHGRGCARTGATFARVQQGVGPGNVRLRNLHRLLSYLRPLPERASSGRHFPLHLQLAALPLGATAPVAVPLLLRSLVAPLTPVAGCLPLPDHLQRHGPLKHPARLRLRILQGFKRQTIGLLNNWLNRLYLRNRVDVQQPRCFILCDYVLPLSNCDLCFH